MVISENSQLGLRFKENKSKVEFLLLMKGYYENQSQVVGEKINMLQTNPDAYDFNEHEQRIYNGTGSDRVKNKVEKAFETQSPFSIYQRLVKDEDSSYYFICQSVYKAAKLIKINSGFTGRAIKDIKDGKYTYLMGINTMVRFLVQNGAIIGFYFNDQKKTAFNFFLEMDEGGYHYEQDFAEEFSTLMQVLIFVELGDIEVKLLAAGRNNGGKRGIDKVTNTSNRTVYVVDSSWNQILIRTDGFAVRGHFRLQACGEAMKDRKLIWIGAFEKHGYKRRPTGEIVK